MISLAPRSRFTTQRSLAYTTFPTPSPIRFSRPRVSSSGASSMACKGVRQAAPSIRPP
jgi:hypothetical protein